MDSCLWGFELRRWIAHPRWLVIFAGVSLLSVCVYAPNPQRLVLGIFSHWLLLLGSAALAATGPFGPRRPVPWSYLASRGVSRGRMRWPSATIALGVMGGLLVTGQTLRGPWSSESTALPTHTAERAKAWATRWEVPLRFDEVDDELTAIEVPGAHAAWHSAACLALLIGLLLRAPSPRSVREDSLGKWIISGWVLLLISTSLLNALSDSPDATGKAVGLVILGWISQHLGLLTMACALCMAAAHRLSSRMWREGDLA